MKRPVVIVRANNLESKQPERVLVNGWDYHVDSGILKDNNKVLHIFLSKIKGDHWLVGLFNRDTYLET